MAVNAATTYVCDRCGKTSPDVPLEPGQVGGTAPPGWSQLILQDMRTMGQRAAHVCDTCTHVILPDFWRPAT